ncbi:primosomal protein DnaI [Bacilli bacterium PM5-3]|nr:primosomal protein DnaI [Bacilli bacterium PM5-3]MDH6603374.1 primosomal protein DnaI [Bacilli bacterium PM5-9]
MKKIELENNINVDIYKNRILEKYKNDDFFIKEYKKYQSELDNIEFIELVEVIESKRMAMLCDDYGMCKQKVRGYRLELDNDGLKYVPCECLKQKKKFEKRYENLLYTTFDLTKDLPEVSDLKKSKGRASVYEYISLLNKNQVKQGLFLSGAPGIGKTFIIETLLNINLKDNKTCAYILLNDFFNEMRSLYFSYDQEDKSLFNRLIKRLKNVNVLIIDDIGAEKVDAIARDEILFPILDSRMKNEKITHFTSNYKMSELEDHYGETSAKISEPIKGKRLLERIRVLSKEFILSDNKSNR